MKAASHRRERFFSLSRPPLVRLFFLTYFLSLRYHLPTTIPATPTNPATRLPKLAASC